MCLSPGKASLASLMMHIQGCDRRAVTSQEYTRAKLVSVFIMAVDLRHERFWEPSSGNADGDACNERFSISSEKRYFISEAQSSIYEYLQHV